MDDTCVLDFRKDEISCIVPGDVQEDSVFSGMERPISQAHEVEWTNVSLLDHGTALWAIKSIIRLYSLPRENSWLRNLEVVM